MAAPFVFHPDYVAAGVPEHHRFPMQKFGAVAERVEALGLLNGGGFHQPAPAPQAWLELAHDHDYVEAVLRGRVSSDRARRIGFPMTEPVARRAVVATAGTVLACRLAMERGAAANLAGGSHHSRREGGAGFCVFNDAAVAARLLLAEGAVRRVLIVDLDVHQGDGTAQILRAEPNATTFSMHCETNWPRQKEASDLDVGLEAGTGDADYLSTLSEILPGLLREADPDLVVYNAGVDVHEADRLGLLKLSEAAVRARDRYVLRRCIERGAPVAGVLGGGYSRDLAHLARLHASLHEAVAEADSPKS